MITVPRSHTTGTAGQHEVCAQLSRIGWGAVPNAYEDFGIDVIAHARDSQLTDKGLLVGVQVKSGHSWFGRPVPDADSPEAWVYSEGNQTHLDYWLHHAIPQLVVLHNPDTLTSHWVHVTASASEVTGKGWKILVPADQTIDQMHADALYQVAATGRLPITLEGSIWDQQNLDISLARQWRYSLIAPRLIAPHQNAGTSAPISTASGTALVVERRNSDLQRFADTYTEVPTLIEASQHAEWGWRFMFAVNAYFDSDFQPAIDCTENAPDSTSLAAAAVLAVCGLCGADRHEMAEQLASRLLESEDSFEAADRAWIIAQRARVLVQLGRPEEARREAMESQRLLVGEPADVTSSAILAGTSWLLWATSDWSAGDLGDVVMKGDTVASWWRDQETSGGLAAYFDDSFKVWSESQAITFVIRDPVASSLSTVMAMADFSAEYGSFHAERSCFAKYLVMSAGSQESSRTGLDFLRQVGDRNSLELTVARMLGEGPVAPVKDVVDGIDHASWTFSSVEGNTALWSSAGEIASPEQAEYGFGLCLDIFASGNLPITRPNLSPAMVRTKALQCFKGLSTSSSIELHSRLLLTLSEFLAGDVLEEAGIAAELSSLLNWIDWSSLSSAQSNLWLEAVTDQRAVNWAPAPTILAKLAAREESARRQLTDLAISGNWSALHSLDSVGVVGDEAAAVLIEGLEPRIRRIVTDAQGGSSGFGGWSLPPILIWLNQCFPNVARWDTIFELISEPKVSSREKAEVCMQLSVNIDSLDASVRSELEDLARKPIHATPGPFPGDNDMPGAAYLLRTSLGVITGDDRLRSLPRLLPSNDRRARAQSAVALGFVQILSEFEIGVLTALAADSSLEVRKAAVKSIGGQIAKGSSHPALVDVLTTNFHVDAVEIPYQGLAGLARRSSPLPGAVNSSLELLKVNHPSGRVRGLAQRLVEAEHASDRQSPPDV
jgi:hypothetical protein